MQPLRPSGRRATVRVTRARVCLKLVKPSQESIPLPPTIAPFGNNSRNRRRPELRRGTLGAHRRHGIAVAARPFPRQSASVVGDRVAAGREIIVGSVLILIRASLVALTRSLVVIRPRLILIAGRLVVITHHLVAITRGAVTHLINRSGRELGAAGRTPRNPGLLAAGWALHSHHLPPSPERALGQVPMVAALAVLRPPVAPIAWLALPTGPALAPPPLP